MEVKGGGGRGVFKELANSSKSRELKRRLYSLKLKIWLLKNETYSYNIINLQISQKSMIFVCINTLFGYLRCLFSYNK